MHKVAQLGQVIVGHVAVVEAEDFILAVHVVHVGGPVGRAVLLAFQEVDLRHSEWVGLGNFRNLLHSDLFWLSMRHTFIYAFFVVLAWIVTSLVVASLIMPLSNRVQSIFRGAFYLPNYVKDMLEG